MALIIEDRVLETSSTTGAGNFTLAGSVTGYKAASEVCVNSDTFYYYIEAVDTNSIPTGEWESGLGTWTTGNILIRTSIHKSSNTNSVVTFGAGTKRVAMALTSTHIKTYAPLINPTFTTAVNINGTSSGTVNIVATPVAGTPTLTLPTVSGKFALERSITSYTAGTYSPTHNSGNPVFLCNTSSGNVTVTLPTAVSNTAIYELKKITTTNSMIINTTSSQTIDDSLTITITEQYESLTIVSDGANWKVI